MVATGRYPRGGAVRLHHFLDACARSRLLRQRQVVHLDATRARLTAATLAAQATSTIRNDVPAEDVALILMTLVMGVEQLLELDYPFDIRAGATAAAPAPRPCGPLTRERSVGSGRPGPEQWRPRC